MFAEWIVAYDIASDRVRRSVATKLASNGDRVQQSVYSLDMSPLSLNNLLEQVGPLLNGSVDKFLAIHLCSNCRTQVRRLGSRRKDPPLQLIVC